MIESRNNVTKSGTGKETDGISHGVNEGEMEIEKGGEIRKRV